MELGEVALKAWELSVPWESKGRLEGPPQYWCNPTACMACPVLGQHQQCATPLAISITTIEPP